VQLGKTPFEVKDAQGLCSNAAQPLLNEACFPSWKGVATPEAVDEVSKLGMEHPMGPLTIADY